MTRGTSPFFSLRSSAKPRSFKAGTKVEIRSDEEGFTGAWFEATVIRFGVSKDNCYSVSYATLFADDNSGSPLKESVHRSFVQPQPPPTDPSAAFTLHQCVEAFHNGGWWARVVCRLPIRSENSSEVYGVYFPTTSDKVEFKASEMKPHLEREKGKWVPVKEIVKVTSLSQIWCILISCKSKDFER